MTPPALELIDVRAGYGRITVLHGVSLALQRGRVFALLGANGAGKTSTLAVASGALGIESGCLHVAGRHVNGADEDALARAGLCHIPEGRGVFPNLTVDDNLVMCTYSSASSIDEIRERAFTRFPRLKERRKQLAGTMSGGEQQMLAMARALVADTGLLLLDEISMGLAPRIVSELYEVVAGLAAEGISILLTEQFARTALAVADEAAVMSHGRIVLDAAPDEVSEFLKDAYLGGAA